MAFPGRGKNCRTAAAMPPPARSINPSTSTPLAKAASSAARMTAALTMGESNQSSELCFFFFDFVLLLLLLLCERDFDERFRDAVSGGTFTKSFPNDRLLRLAVSGLEDDAGCRLIPLAICSANRCR